MRRVKIGVALATSGVLVGLGMIGWMKLHPADQAATVTAGGSVPIDTSATPTPASELQVKPVNPSTAQGMVASGDTGASGQRGGTGSNTSTTSSPGAPAPADFKQYEQYKTSQSALFGDIAAGQGAAVDVGKVVTVSYRGWLTDGTLFDEASADKPFAFTEGEHRVIPGWEQGLFGMKVGGKRRVIVPPGQGYGDQAHGPIPGGSVLVFDIELLSVK